MCSYICVYVLVTQLCSTLCDPLNHSPPGFCPWDSPGKNPGMGGHVLLQVIYLYICNINTYTFCTMIKMKKKIDIQIYICNYVYKSVNIYTHINVTCHVCIHTHICKMQRKILKEYKREY